MTIVGVVSSAPTGCRRSKSFAPRAEISSSKQQGTAGRDKDIKSSADLQLSTANPLIEITRCNDRRMYSSSTTRKTIGVIMRGERDEPSEQDECADRSACHVVSSWTLRKRGSCAIDAVTTPNSSIAPASPRQETFPEALRSVCMDATLPGPAPTQHPETGCCRPPSFSRSGAVTTIPVGSSASANSMEAFKSTSP